MAGTISRHGSLSASVRRVLLVAVVAWGSEAAASDDVHYQTLMPPIFPPSPSAGNRPGVLGSWSQLHARRSMQTPRMVVLADEPRQAALSALQNPCLGATLSSYALAAAVEAERQQVVTCVDLYFEAVAFSWHFLQSQGSALRPEYSSAWQVYHESLARLLHAAQRFGRLDPGSGLRVVTPMGLQTIPTRYNGFVWKPADFSRVEVPLSNAPRQLQNHYTCPGLGVPLVVIRENQAQHRFLLDQMPFNATVILRPSLAVLAGQAPSVGAASSHGPLEFHDPLRVTQVAFKQQCIALATNTSAALEYALNQETLGPCQALRGNGVAEPGEEKLFMLEPYQAGKYPVVFVHGYYSSPQAWADITNEILACPDVRHRVHLMAYRYCSGRPFLESAAVLRRELLALKETYDPQGQDPGIANTALVGHSLGGLLCKLTVTHSDDRLWNGVACRPLDDINISPAGRERLRSWFYFEPVPFVRRVVFMGTPHSGAQLGSRLAARCRADQVRLPSDERIEHDLLVKQNPGVFRAEAMASFPTSIDLLEPSSCLLRSIKVLCPGGNVQLHNIVGVGWLAPLWCRGDGAVSRRSAQHHGVSTEKQVATSHAGLHRDEDTVRELICILRRHILEANDVPSLDDCPTVAPDCFIPGFVEPDCEMICPDESELCPDEMPWCPDLLDICPAEAEICPEQFEWCPEQILEEPCWDLDASLECDEDTSHDAPCGIAPDAAVVDASAAPEPLSDIAVPTQQQLGKPATPDVPWQGPEL